MLTVEQIIADLRAQAERWHHAAINTSSIDPVFSAQCNHTYEAMRDTANMYSRGELVAKDAPPPAD
jgi:hypothetical protein